MMPLDSEDKGAFDVTFYVPCLNEEDNIGPTLETLAEVVSKLRIRGEVLVFDDGSTDGTARVVEELRRELAAAHPELVIELITLPQSRGLGANFFDGAARGRGVRYMLVNGDHSERADALEAVLGRLGEADLVITYFETGDVRGPLRRGISRLFTALVNLLNGHRLRYYNGPTLHRRLDVVSFRTDCHGFAYQAELLTRQLDAGRSYVEVPMISRDRQSGVSKAFTFRNLASVARSLWRIRTRRFGSADRAGAVPRAAEGPRS